MPTIQRSAEQREVSRNSSGALRLFDQVETKPASSLIEVLGCRVELSACRGVEPNRHRREKRALSSAKTCSPGMVSTKPSSISRLRRSISSSHSRSASGSGGPSSSSRSTRNSRSLSASGKARMRLLVAHGDIDQLQFHRPLVEPPPKG